MTDVIVRQTESSSPQRQPLVSVIINNYNYGRFVRRAIASVLAQTYRNFELIIVDDGSPDNSQEVIETYCAECQETARAQGELLPPIITIFQPNLGQNTACNAGFQVSRGEIVCFLDADDYFYPQKLEKVVQAFQAHPEWVQIAHCWTSVNKHGEPTGRGTSDQLSQGDVTPLLLQWGRYASGITSALAYRRHILTELMPSASQWRIGIDSYLNVCVPFYGLIGHINEPLMYYRIHGKNRKAHNNNIAYLLRDRRIMVDCLNHTAAKLGLTERFSLERDADYRAFAIIEQQGGALADKLAVMKLSLQESRAIGRSWRDTAIRLISRSICVLFPKDAPTFLRLGFRQYMKQKFRLATVEETHPPVTLAVEGGSHSQA